MNNPEFYRNLRFETQARFAPHRLIAIVLSLVVFTLLWLLVSHIALYCVLLPLLCILAWVASYGWRQALAALHDLIHCGFAQPDDVDVSRRADGVETIDVDHGCQETRRNGRMLRKIDRSQETLFLSADAGEHQRTFRSTLKSRTGSGNRQ